MTLVTNQGLCFCLSFPTDTKLLMDHSPQTTRGLSPRVDSAVHTNSAQEILVLSVGQLQAKGSNPKALIDHYEALK